jgi:hypothetical protein
VFRLGRCGSFFCICFGCQRYCRAPRLIEISSLNFFYLKSIGTPNWYTGYVSPFFPVTPHSLPLSIFCLFLSTPRLLSCFSMENNYYLFTQINQSTLKSSISSPKSGAGRGIPIYELSVSSPQLLELTVSHGWSPPWDRLSPLARWRAWTAGRGLPCSVAPLFQSRSFSFSSV